MILSYPFVKNILMQLKTFLILKLIKDEKGIIIYFGGRAS